MLAFFLAREIGQDLSLELPLGAVFTSLNFVAQRQECAGRVVYCDLRFIFFAKTGQVEVKTTASFMDLTLDADLGEELSGKEEESSDDDDNDMAQVVNFDSSEPDCCGIACSMALRVSRESRSAATDDSITDVVDTCLARRALPTLSTMAASPAFESIRLTR